LLSAESLKNDYKQFGLDIEVLHHSQLIAQLVESGFCCGAGGGRMWMEEQSGTGINIERVMEAMKQHPDTLCVSCPYCMTMIEDGLKDLGVAEKVRVKDIAEVAAEAIK